MLVGCGQHTSLLERAPMRLGGRHIRKHRDLGDMAVYGRRAAVVGGKVAQGEHSHGAARMFG